MSMTLIVLKPDDVKAAYTQETDNAGVLCGDPGVWGRCRRDLAVCPFIPFHLCTTGMYYVMKCNQTKKIKEKQVPLSYL